jgi:radical SAM superfamily enzyme YgiQ (UPF0313 family)
MRILLVRPPRIKQAITLSDFMFSEPLGLEMVYGLLMHDHEVEIFDMMVDRMPLPSKLESFLPDAVGFTSLCIDVHMVLELCREVKGMNPALITLVGGTQAYLNPLAFADEAVDHIMEFVDESNLVEFFVELEKSKRDSKQSIHGTLDVVPSVRGIRSQRNGFERVGNPGRNCYLPPYRASTDKYRNEYSYFGYKPAAIMEYGIGCEKVCDFCLRWRIEGAKEKLLNLEMTRQDLQTIQEPTVMLIDNDFFASEYKIRTFLNLLRELDIQKNFIVYASVKGIIEFEPLVREFKELGLKAVLIGYETFKDEEMTAYKKKSGTGDNPIAARILERLDIDVWASFMAHPDWSVEDFKTFRRYIRKLNPQISSINPLTPFPNLPLYQKFENRLIYRPEEFERWSFGQVMITPKQISLKRYYYELLKTNLYVNLFLNRPTEMLSRYGIKNVFRMLSGSSKTLIKYWNLMKKG